MSKNTYTAGPWASVDHNWSDTSIYGYSQQLIASMSIRDEATEENQEKLEATMSANAKIIAAAPTMLELLREAKLGPHLGNIDGKECICFQCQWKRKVTSFLADMPVSAQ